MPETVIDLTTSDPFLPAATPVASAQAPRINTSSHEPTQDCRHPPPAHTVNFHRAQIPHEPMWSSHPDQALLSDGEPMGDEDVPMIDIIDLDNQDQPMADVSTVLATKSNPSNASLETTTKW